MANITRVFDLLNKFKNTPDQSILVSGKYQGKWRNYSSHEFIEIVNNFSKGLLAKGYKKGDRIGIMSGNRPEWSFTEFACSQLGIAIVPLYPTLSNHDLSYIVSDSEVGLVLTGSIELSKRVQGAKDEHHLNLHIICFDQDPAFDYFGDLIALGKTQDYDVQALSDQVTEDDLLTLIYTSGTTGQPKGVFLTHKNLVSTVLSCTGILGDGFKRAASFLPLSHIFERMVSLLYFSRGVEIHFIENLDHVVEDLNEIKPDCFTTVPRVLEKVYDKIVAKGKELSGIKRKLFFWALNLGLQYKNPTENSSFYKLKLSIARKLIFSKWKAALGGNVKGIISGGAALQERLARVFFAAGIKVLEGYGLTETSPVIAVNTLEDTGVKFGTVGRPISISDVKIAEDGEILVKGPNVTSGYYKNEEATKEAFDADGYFKTGDIGELTADGFLKITDRKKEMFKTAGGKYVAPQVIENKLMESTFIAQVMVIGENKKFPSALIIPNFEVLEKWAKQKNISFKDHEELAKNPLVKEKYEAEIKNLSNDFGQWEKVKQPQILAKEWTINAGELTPKLSLKRKVILKNNAELIDNLYQE